MAGVEWQGQQVLCPGKGSSLSPSLGGDRGPGQLKSCSPFRRQGAGAWSRGSGLPAPALLGTESASENPEGITSLPGQFAQGTSGVRCKAGPGAAPDDRVVPLLWPLSRSWGRGSCGHSSQTMETAPPVHPRTRGRQREANPNGGTPLGREEDAVPTRAAGNGRPRGSGRTALRVSPRP